MCICRNICILLWVRILVASEWFSGYAVIVLNFPMSLVETSTHHLPWIDISLKQTLLTTIKYAMHKTCVPVPSPNLLRFLRSKADDISFFSSNTRFDRGRSALQPDQKPFFRRTSSCLPRSARPFTTSRPCKATVESSFLNLDFLRHPPRHEELFTKNGAAVTSLSTTSRAKRNPLRYASTEDPSLLRRWWGRSRGAQPATRMEELSPIPSFLDDGSGTSLARSMAGKPANELRLRCTEINENGDVTLVHGEFKKSELIAKVGFDCLESLKAFDWLLIVPLVWSSTARSTED